MLTSLLNCHRGCGVQAELHTLLPTSSGERSSPSFRHVGLERGRARHRRLSQWLDHLVDESVLLVLVPPH